MKMNKQIKHKIYKLQLIIKKGLKIYFRDNQCEESSEIDLVIPTTLKDEDLLNVVIQSAKKYILHKIKNVFIITNKNSTAFKLCKNNLYNFIDENKLMGYSKTDIKYKANEKDRAGWIYQQLLKLNSDKFVKSKNYLILDSDTVLINKICFIKNKKYIFQNSIEWHKPYFENFFKIFKYKAENKLSCIAHMMIFNVEKLKEMKLEISKKNNKKWDDVILSLIDNKESSFFSEYETYSNWLSKNYPTRVRFVPFYNKALPKKDLTTLNELNKKYGKKYKSISFHSYLN